MVERRKHSRRGFNLIEAAIVLGVVGLVIGGIWWGAAAVNEHMKVNDIVKNIFSIGKDIGNQFTASQGVSIGGYDLTNLAISTKSVPDNWVKQTSIVTQFGTRLYVLGGGDRFYLQFNGIPESACVKIILKVSAIARQSAGTSIPSSSQDTFAYNRGLMFGMRTYNLDYSDAWWANHDALSLTLARAQDACSGGTPKMMIFYFPYTRTN